MQPKENEKVDPVRLRQQIADADAIKAYIQKKPLARPRTNAFTICAVIFAFAISTLLEAYGIIYIFNLQPFTPWVLAIAYLVNFIVWLRYIATKAVECYQHYAKEQTRRRCLCKPTCSEYAIEVLNKYCVFVALYKIYKRLFKTCKNDFKIDLP